MKKISITSELRAVSAWHESEKQARGTVREWALCLAYGIERKTHDNLPYYKGSDIEVDGLNISVKAARFTLMAGSLCEGREDFDGIWNLYESKVHSDTFAYVTENGIAYMMNLSEFKQFVYATCGTERESEKNGKAMKIKMRSESRKVLEWLEARVA
jgi:hypothetical protein